MLSYTAIEQVYSLSWANGYVRESQYQQLQKVRQANQLSALENQSIDRIILAVHQGWLKVV